MGIFDGFFAKDTIRKEDEIAQFVASAAPYVNSFRLGNIVEHLKQHAHYEGKELCKKQRFPFEKSKYCAEKFEDMKDLCRQIREYCEYSGEVAYQMSYIPFDAVVYSSPVVVLWYLHDSNTEPYITFEIR